MKSVKKALLAIEIFGAVFLAEGASSALANPYADSLNANLPVARVAEMPTRADLQTTWDFPAVCADLEIRVWGVTSPLSTQSSGMRTALLAQIETEMNYLLNADNYQGGRWWWEGLTLPGDANVDRFTLTTVIESAYKLSQAGLLAADTPGWLASIKTAVDFQYNNYGQKNTHDWATKLAGSYPNMDAAYTLIMGAASLAYSPGTNYGTSAHAFATSIKNLVQSDGTLPYMAGVGASLGYTAIVVNWLARYQALTGDTTARDAIVAQKNYYPKQLILPGFSEVTTAPWFKRAVAAVSPTAGPVAVVAGMASDPRSAYFAQQLLANGFSGLSDAPIASVYWASLAGTGPTDSTIAVDPDVAGFRANFGSFSWVGSANPGTDAFAGALLTTSEFYPNGGFEDIDSSDDFPYDFSTSVYAGTPSFAADASTSHGGSHSIRIGGTTSDRGAVEMDNSAIFGGHHYRFTVWYQTASGVAASAVVPRAQLLDATGVAIPWSLSWISDSTGDTPTVAGGCLNMPATSTAVGTWKSATLAFQAPSNAVRFKMELFNWVGNGPVWYDDLTFIDLDSGGAPVNIAAMFQYLVPEVGILGSSDSALLKDQAAYISHLTYPHSALVGGNRDFSVLGLQYQPQRPSDPTNTPRENAAQAWNVNQVWLCLADRIVGAMKMTSTASHQDKYVRTRIRTAPVGSLRQLDASHFTAAGLNLTLLQNDFTGVATGPADTSDANPAPAADEIFLTEAGASRPSTYATGASHSVTVDVAPSTTGALSGYASLSSGSAFSGFRVPESGATYDVWFNGTASAAVLSYAMPSSTYQTANTVYVSGTGTATVQGTSISGSTVGVTVPAYGSACVVQSRNLLADPGFEQLNTSGIPVGYSYETLAGSPSVSVDTTTNLRGQNSVKVTGTGSDRGGFNSLRVPVIAGKNYKVVFGYRPDATIAASGIIVRLMAWKTTGNTEADKVPWSTSWVTSSSGCAYVLSGNNLNVSPSGMTSNTWNQASLTFTAPAGIISLSLEGLIWLGIGSVNFDEINITQVP